MQKRLFHAVLFLSVVVSVCCVVLMTFFRRDVSLSEMREDHRSRLREVWLAVWNYSEVEGVLPYDILSDDGTSMSSWRFRVLPFLMSTGKEKHFDKAWNSEDNIEHAVFRPQDFCDGSSPSANIVAITGRGAAFDRNRRNSLAEIPDDCILFVEAKHFSKHWMEPGDLDIGAMSRKIPEPDGNGICGLDRWAFHVCFADGQVWLLSNDVPFEELEVFFTIDGATRCDRERALGVWQVVGDNHGPILAGEYERLY